MRLTPSLKLGLIAFLAVDLALAFVFGALYFLRSDLKLEEDLRNVGATIYQAVSYTHLTLPTILLV